ncbi:MAG: hypothetical protein V4689_07575 [Verrucomicrobiota bacterium]
MCLTFNKILKTTSVATLLISGACCSKKEVLKPAEIKKDRAEIVSRQDFRRHIENGVKSDQKAFDEAGAADAEGLREIDKKTNAPKVE